MSLSIILMVYLSHSLERCIPTPSDMEGPFYKPNAPLRNITGKGFTVRGRVLSYPDCKPAPDAKIEYWHANPYGVYDAHRATLFRDKDGRYEFTTDFPGIYSLEDLPYKF
ncbi:MAG: hypothetical protein N2511_01305 [Thermodesulfovibrionales bacterium]|nr:hypothetical protein [Thermodesulfovibrionales bacterium]